VKGNGEGCFLQTISSMAWCTGLQEPRLPAITSTGPYPFAWFVTESRDAMQNFAAF
jgi:hypothetical protein